MSTRWLPVVGYESFYEVSDHGAVRRLRRATAGRDGVIMHFPAIALVGTETDAGYVRVTLSRDGRRQSVFVHDLVLEAFVGPRPEAQEGCHGNGDGLDNALSNLRWDTRSGNQRDSVRHGTHASTKKTHCPQNHPYSDENTYYAARGSRNCRTCAREATRRYTERKSA